MKKHQRELTDDFGDRTKFRMCNKKKKFKSSEASRIADMYGQRKYECPICGHWHLTKQK